MENNDFHVFRIWVINKPLICYNQRRYTRVIMSANNYEIDPFRIAHYNMNIYRQIIANVWKRGTKIINNIFGLIILRQK